MNKQVRQRLTELAEQIGSIVCEMRDIADKEREKYDNAPENLQDSERVQAYEECASAIESVCDELENNMGELEDDVINVY